MFSQRPMYPNGLEEARRLQKIRIINQLDVDDPVWFWYRWWFQGKTAGAKGEL
jgi:hypothetical protein